MTTKLCERCKRRIKGDAITCLCGWSLGLPEQSSRNLAVSCCYSNCLEPALCRVWTVTGWANVCVSHYGLIATVPRPSTSPVVLEIRKAYLGSFAFGRREGTIAEKLPVMREPGQDDDEPALGIPLDDLERELTDRLNP